MTPSSSASWVSHLILLLLCLRIGQMSVTAASSLDLIWWTALWGFHWRRHTGRRLSLLSLVLPLPGLISHGTLWLLASAACLGLLQLQASRDESLLEHSGWDRLWWP